MSAPSMSAPDGTGISKGMQQPDTPSSSSATNAEASSSTTHTPGPAPATPVSINRPSTPPVPVPASSARLRSPVPPSPLSKMSSPDHGALLSPALPQHNQQASPCFIHSLLDKHGNGSLQDWLKNKAGPQNTNGHPAPGSPGSSPTHTGASHQHHVHLSKTKAHVPTHGHSHLRPHTPASAGPAGSSAAPPPGASSSRHQASGSNGGYESDRSSGNGPASSLSAGFGGDYSGSNGGGYGGDDDEDEAGGSLTKQLAETAQGVREMSKELGRTRVRSKIQTVLIVTKARDNRLIQLTRELALYLMMKKPPAPNGSGVSSEGSNRPASATATSPDRGLIVYVDAQLRQSKRFDAAGIQRDHPELFEPVMRRRSSSTASLPSMSSAHPSTANLSEFSAKKKDFGQLRYWTAEMCSHSPHLFDFVITLGGDGTVLFTSWLFQKIVPPVLPFALGSLGFLTNFDFSDYKQTMDRVIDDGIRVNLRMRFTCTVYRAIAPEELDGNDKKAAKRRKAIKKPGGEILINQVDQGGWDALEGPSSNCAPCREGKDKEIMCFSTRPVEQFEVLNDLVVDRGPSPFVSLLELFGDEHHLTTVQADGLILATPTGSTAYSLSAGGSLVHPQIPALLISPICPHTLSFRPMLLPDSMELRICVPYNSRSTAWASFDGRGRVELKQGDHIKISASKYPFPTVCADKASTDWFSSISRTLRWNEREKQKSFVVVEEDRSPAAGTNQFEKRKKAEKSFKEPTEVHHEADEEGEEEEEPEPEQEEEEEEFDIDDKSSGATTPSSPVSSNTSNSNQLQSTLSAANGGTGKGKGHHNAGTKSGVETPSRFASKCRGPPPISERHLIHALQHQMDLEPREGESGAHDELHLGSSSHLRTEGPGHNIPLGRQHESAGGDAANGERSGGPDGSVANAREREANVPDQGTPKPQKRPSFHENKSKAFAFFGQDDSSSDMSDEE